MYARWSWKASENIVLAFLVCNKEENTTRFLNLARLPATIDAEQTAILLGMASTGIAVLVAHKFLKPLGRNLAANAPRRFASVTIEGLAREPAELNRMQQILTQHWHSCNKAKK